jgi:hypothetical protein
MKDHVTDAIVLDESAKVNTSLILFVDKCAVRLKLVSFVGPNLAQAVQVETYTTVRSPSDWQKSKCSMSG